MPPPTIMILKPLLDDMTEIDKAVAWRSANDCCGNLFFSHTQTPKQALIYIYIILESG